MTYEWQIKPGDTVKVFPTMDNEVSYVAKVRYMPQATGDSWILENKDFGICYQQTFNRIVLIKRAEGNVSNDKSLRQRVYDYLMDLESPFTEAELQSLFSAGGERIYTKEDAERMCELAVAAYKVRGDGVDISVARVSTERRIALPEGVKLAFVVKTDGEFWYLHGEDVVPGLNLAYQDLQSVLDSVIPAWAKLHEYSPKQVPAPPNSKPNTASASTPGCTYPDCTCQPNDRCESAERAIKEYAARSHEARNAGPQGQRREGLESDERADTTSHALRDAPTLDGWKLYCEAFQTLFGYGPSEEPVSPAALQQMAERIASARSSTAERLSERAQSELRGFSQMKSGNWTLSVEVIRELLCTRSSTQQPPYADVVRLLRQRRNNELSVWGIHEWEREVDALFSAIAPNKGVEHGR